MRVTVQHQTLGEDAKTLLREPKIAVCQANPAMDDSQSTSSEGSTTSGEERAKWGKQLDFFLSCVGYAVGLGNIWRFPYLCYRSGGGAFLVPYLLFLIICGMPLFFLELSFGQFASLGPVAIWKICPLFKGLGYGMVVISGIVCIYYNVIISWTLFYIYKSLAAVVPWASCGNPWNTEACVDHRVENATRGAVSSSEEYWKYNVLQVSDGVDNPGEIRWPLLGTLAIAWVMVFLCLIRGVKSSGKVVYFSATFPYVVLVILLIRGLTLPGAWDGIYFYLTPRWELLKSFQVWGDAATQIFYSVGAAWGAILTMASYNRFDNNCYRDALLIPIINCGTSIFAGFVVFSIIGFMAYETGQPVESVVDQGPGLAFVVYPEAVARLPLSPLWAILFFIMLFTIGLDSQFGMFEATISAFVDEFPQYLKKRKVAFNGLMCTVLFILGIPCVTQGGMYVLRLMDHYSATFALMIISFLETIVIGWIYGSDRFMQDINLMINRTPGWWWTLCWCVITPVTILCLLIFIVATHEAVDYGSYEFPPWSLALGWIMAVLPLLPLPICAAVAMCKARGSFMQRLRACVRPEPTWGPARPNHRLLYKKSLADTPPRFLQRYVAGVERSPSADNSESAV
ncbi:hypothetical protein LAZ67_1008228 [Cordylochernes scorpioides]|uniref:Transporter n=1 Tax=Cordylochernes scorpioides TaxID=51811 RepID=A0ABY6K087_9ARAC|nr:hypothetical protein LAZ67_1008228 [Cordylochernes scorpioides]